jgi:hypothetical protein
MAAVYNELSARGSTRCIAPLFADGDRHMFLLGSSNIKGGNEVRGRETWEGGGAVCSTLLLHFRLCLQVHVVEYDEDSETVAARATLSHPNEVWTIAACPSDASLFFTGHSSAGKRLVLSVSMQHPEESLSMLHVFYADAGHGVTLWRMPSLEDDGDGSASAVRVVTPAETELDEVTVLCGHKHPIQ